MRKVKRVGQQRKSSRAGYQSSTADGPPPGGEPRRRPSEQEQALAQKNYRLAKELVRCFSFAGIQLGFNRGCCKRFHCSRKKSKPVADLLTCEILILCCMSLHSA